MSENLEALDRIEGLQLGRSRCHMEGFQLGGSRCHIEVRMLQLGRSRCMVLIQV